MKNVMTIIALIALMQGCTAQTPRRPAFGLGDFMSSALKELPYDSPPQVIYRIDDHRFVTLERYRDCHHGESYYNDTRAGIRKFLGRGMFENFQGRIINADPSGQNIVLPLAYPNEMVCGNGEKGCAVPFWYSLNGGKTFATKVYADHSFNPFEDSKKYAFAVTRDSIFVSKKISETVDVLDTDRYPLISNSMHKRIEFDAKMPSNLRTPSGQDRITCDTSIKPTNPDAPLIPQ
ncbi:hypothetical protein CFB89_20065 [Burkholderia sp. AU16741]|uniref:T6SS immunity protein Tli3 family protein n=1 Tax=unclassified Burkholderia TaxID=2613784 RepID=UPI000B79F519|nr:MULTISPECIES: hypothetical protein [unclassified Burkholderia]MDN7428915.1 hypothetical protein [Burkholderia sp. AU45388]OXI31703.1 hypothetical protein CFB89_20065 [Burkholderia sp. AU16741]